MSDESTVSQALARLRWYERHLGTDLLLSSWLWLVGCVAYALNSGAELYTRSRPNPKPNPDPNRYQVQTEP